MDGYSVFWFQRFISPVRLALVGANWTQDRGMVCFFSFSLSQSVLFSFIVERNFGFSVPAVASELPYISLMFASTDEDCIFFPDVVT